MANLTVSANIDTFMGSADNAAARSNLSAAKSGANTDISSVALTTGTITTTPGSANDIVNKSYADSIGSGVNFHTACDYGTIAALSPAASYNQPGGAGVGVNATLTGSTNAVLQVDGVTVSTTQRILVKNQGSAFQNGIYTVTQQGDGSTVPYILTRATDYDTSGTAPNEVAAGDFVIILNSTLANTAWVQQTPAPINFGVTSIVFIQFAAANPGVTSFSTTLSGLTPSSATTGAVTLAGTLGVANGGTGQVTAAAALTALGGAAASVTQVFTSNGTWTKPAGAQSVNIQLLGGGAGGASGARNITGAIRLGGGGGGGGGFFQATVPASALGATETVTIGAGGNGGAGIASPANTVGIDGSVGADTIFGVFRAVGGFNGRGSTTGAAGTGLQLSNSGGAAASAGTSGSPGVPGTTTTAFAPGGAGGGAGAGMTAVSAPTNGGAGGRSSILNITGGTGGVPGAAGSAGSPNPTPSLFAAGSGGGGGGSSVAGAGGAGGAGGFPAGGGGGGGATESGTTSGAGGAGAAGIAIVTTYF